MARYGGTNTVHTGQFNSAQSDFVWLMTEDNFATAAIDGGAQSILNGGGNLRCYTDDTKSVQLPIQVVKFVTGIAPSIVVKGLSPLLDDAGTVYIEADTLAISQPPVTDPFGRNATYPDFQYTFNMNSVPTVTNSSGNSDGLAVNGPTVVGGKIGEAISFVRASDQRVDLSNGVDIGENYTFSVWANTDDRGAVQGVISSRNEGLTSSDNVIWYQTLVLNDRYSIFLNDGLGPGFLSVENPALALENVYQKITGVRSGGTLSLYVDGQFIGSDSRTLGTLSTAGVVNYLSGFNNGGSFAAGFSGDLDDNYVRKIALSADYIEAEYNNENNPSTFWSVGAWEDQDAGGITTVITESYQDFSESINAALQANASALITEAYEDFTEFSLVDISPAVSIEATITETYQDFSESVGILISAPGTVDSVITESYSDFSETISADVSVNLSVNITESYSDFSESIDVALIKDVSAIVTESYADFSESINIKLPVSIIVNPRNRVNVKKSINTVRINKTSNIVRVR